MTSRAGENIQKTQAVEKNILRKMAGRWKVDRVGMEEIRGEDKHGTLSDQQAGQCISGVGWTCDTNGRRMTSKESLEGRGQQERIWETKDTMKRHCQEKFEAKRTGILKPMNPCRGLERVVKNCKHFQFYIKGKSSQEVK